MKYKNPKQSKAERIYNIFLQNPDKLFSSRDIIEEFNRPNPDKIDLKNTSKWLSVIMKKNKILRTPTQTEVGYVYSLRNQEALDNHYKNYLLPYDFNNKEKILDLILNKNFEILKKGIGFKDISSLKFVKKYGEEHLKREATQIFLSKLVAFIIGDGHIRKNKGGAQFFFREKIDAESFKDDFLNIFYKENMQIIKKEYCYATIISSVSLIELLILLEAPVGNKVFQAFQIPSWIYYGNNNIKLAFLSVI